MNPTSYDWTNATDEEILNVDLIDALGLATESDEAKQDFLAHMTDTVQQAVALRLTRILDSEAKNQLDILLDENDPYKINEFLTTAVPNFPGIMTEETIKFKRAMLTGQMPAAIA